MQGFSIMKQKNILSNLLEGILQLIYPPVCTLCQQELPDDSRFHFICNNCLNSCQRILPFFIQKNILDRLIPCHLDDLKVVFEFDERLQQIIHNIKYQKMSRLAFDFGVYCQSKLSDDLFDIEAIVLPVPLHPSREKERGYNQSYHLARGLFDAKNRSIKKDILIRKRNTQTQTELDRKERQENVHKAFEIQNPQMISGKRVIIVDDVVTTGATLNECACTLKTAGAKETVGVAIATPREHFN